MKQNVFIHLTSALLATWTTCAAETKYEPRWDSLDPQPHGLNEQQQSAGENN